MEYGLVLVWLATYLVLALAALPVAGALFPRFADRGAAFAPPVALAVVGVVGFLVGHVPGAFGWPALVAGLVVLVGASYLAGDRVEVDTRAYGEVAVVFAIAFLFVVAIRAVDPAVHPVGGEKFLDFGLLSTLLRADALPPESMWFAGEPVRYYYGGHMLAALLATLTFTPAAFAYNLAHAGFYATLVTAAYGLASNVAADRGIDRRLAGGFAAFFAGLASNLVTAGQVLLWLVPDGLAGSLAGALGLEDAAAWTPAQFSYWTASRIIPGTINEFPLFAWLNGDMHAHMASMGFTLLVAALLYSYWQTPATERRRRRVLVFGVLPPLAGFIALVNTWSFPSAVGLTWLALAFASARPRSLLPDAVLERFGVSAPGADADPGRADGGETAVGEYASTDEWLRDELARTGTALALAVGVLVVAAVWALPYWFVRPESQGVGFLPDRSSLGALLLVHGGFLLAFVPYLARRAAPDVEQPLLAAAVVVLFGLAAWSFGFAAVGLFAPILVVAWGLLRFRRDVGFETLLVLAGTGIVLLVEFAFVQENAGPQRFNTVFKSYTQVWILWSVAIGVVLTRLVSDGAGRAREAAGERAEAVPGTTPSLRSAASVLAVVLVFSTSMYAGFALPQHFAGDTGYYAQFARVDDPTLDATAFVAEQHPEEAAAIAWVRNLEGKPNIVTAAPAGYFWTPSEGKGSAAPASLTGVPTVAGWFEERGYRGPDVYNARVADVKTIYGGPPDRQAALLRKYDVEYVYVGPAERNAYGEITVGDLQGVSVAEEFAYQGETTVVVYEVDQSALPES